MPVPPPPRPSAGYAGAAQPGGGQAGPGPRSSPGEREGNVFFLGRYRVVDEIGGGGMASVHLGRMDGPGGFQKWVAIKRIHPHLVEDDQFVDMFLDEARIAAGINHANVAQVFDLGKDDNTYWIAMEYLHGEPLREVMRRSEEHRVLVSPELAARIGADSAEGLHAAHELRGKNGQLLGLVHRDVTPHNLFITYDGYTKVVDFGIAKVADRLSSTRAGTLKGKLAYMSPEQVRGAEIDRTTDIFALGVVLWELTTGHRLFRMDTDLDTLERVQACVVPPPSTLVANYPVELESVIMKALAKRKEDRFQTAREFSRALQAVLMRRGAFVGPEEVSAYLHHIFADRIQKREAHLAWAAEVTSNISLDDLRAGQAVLPGPARDLALHAPKPAPSQPVAQLPPRAPTLQGFAPPSAPAQALAATSLVDDDEDIATTVATRDHLDGAPSAPTGGHRGAPRPAAGLPAHHGSQAPAETFGETVAMSGGAASMQAQIAQLEHARQQHASLGNYGMPGQPPPRTAASPMGPPSFAPPPPIPAQFPAAPPGAFPQSHVPTALSMPRAADPAARWMAHQQSVAPASSKKNTLVLVAVGLLTAVCVAGIAWLIYAKTRAVAPTPVASAETSIASAAPAMPSASAPQPSASAAASNTAPAASASASASAAPVATATSAAPSATAKPAATHTTAAPASGKEEPGYLTIVCNPFCDDVIDSGRSLGPSPIVHVAAKPGQHRVTLKRSGSAPKTISVIVVSGQVTAQRVSMK